MDNMENRHENVDLGTESLQDTTIPEKQTKQNKVNEMQNNILSYLHDLVFLLAGLLILFVLLFRIVVVSGESMYSTLHEGDYLVVLSSGIYKTPKQGDVVVVSKNSYKDGEPLVKRVIAVGGQTVQISSGQVIVDGVHIEGEYTHEGFEVDFPLVVEEGCVFVLGDNRDNSKDSRSNEIGMIDEREVLGKVLFIALPAQEENGRRNFSRFGAV